MRIPAPTCALITGASLGLGRSLAEECAARGMNLVLVALPGSGLLDLGVSISKSRNVSVECLEADLTDPDTPDRLIAMIRSKGLQIDLLVNNAGIGPIGLFADSTLEYHEATIRLNVLAFIRLTRFLLPELRNRHAAYILNVASLGAFFPMLYMPIYSATKSFMLHFSLALRDELSGTIGVSVLCPNTIKTSHAIQELIDRLGLPCRLACLYPHQVARAALDGLLRGKAIIVPGFLNKILRVAAPFVPRALVTRVVRHYWGRYGTPAEVVATDG